MRLNSLKEHLSKEIRHPHVSAEYHWQSRLTKQPTHENQPSITAVSFSLHLSTLETVKWAISMRYATRQEVQSKTHFFHNRNMWWGKPFVFWHMAIHETSGKVVRVRTRGRLLDSTRMHTQVFHRNNSEAKKGNWNKNWVNVYSISRRFGKRELS